MILCLAHLSWLLGYSTEQVDDSVRQLGLFAGSRGLQACQQDDEGLRRAADMQPTALDEAHSRGRVSRQGSIWFLV
jgi:hypothetical protein